MNSITSGALGVLASAAVLGSVPTALAHGDDMHMTASEADIALATEEYPPSYFGHADYRAAIYGHIVLMVSAWVFLLPVAVMFSLTRSRHTLVLQFVFTAVNAGGALLGVVYNRSTPDLYPGNAHHRLGWVVICVVGAQVAIGLLIKVVGVARRGVRGPSRAGLPHESDAFISVAKHVTAEHGSEYQKAYRFSMDSGHGTEPTTASLRSHSSSSGAGASASSPPIMLRDVCSDFYRDGHYTDLDGGDDFPAPGGVLETSRATLSGTIPLGIRKLVRFSYAVVDRTSLIMGFVALCTGIATYGRFFEGREIFSGLAHWIKGGIFFWFGILTLGRWAGCFGELGWAWNIRPRSSFPGWRPSAEFVESALIFTYGATNIFLEHLGGWGGEYSAEDLEHISITVLFIGGGLCGMLVESSQIRELLNTTVDAALYAIPEQYHDRKKCDELRQPDTYPFSTNPIPALVILLLGIMMSSHTQHNMASSMIHHQWGNLLAGGAVMRALTYLTMFLKPPSSVYPSRPPTELLTSFGLISGGILFMASSRDTVAGMVHHQLDVMFMYTVTMGVVGLLMAWVIIVVALKGWAMRKELGCPTPATGRV